MATGVYEVCLKEQGNPLSLRISLPEQSDLIVPKDQLILKNAVYNTLFVLRQLKDARHPSVDVYAKQLKTIAELGLSGSEAQTEDAMEDLGRLQALAVSNEGQIIKNKYAKILGRMAGVYITLALGIYMAIKADFGADALGILRTFGMTTTDLVWLRSYIVAWAGAMAGAWVCFVWRDEVLGYNDLNRVRPSWQGAQIRLLGTAVQTMAIGLLMHKGVLSFQVGDFDTRLFPTDSVTAILVGVLCGYSEKNLPMLISSKAGNVLGETKDSQQPQQGGSFNKMLSTLRQTFSSPAKPSTTTPGA